MPGPLLAHGSRVLATREPSFSGPSTPSGSRGTAGWWILDRWAVACAALNGIGWAAVVLRWQAPGERFAYGALVSVLVVVAVIDTRTSRIPDRISKPAMALAGGVALAGCAATTDGHRLAAVAVGTLLCWGALGVAHVASPRSLGRGDVKLGVTLGVALGWAAVRPADAVVLVLGAFLGASAVGTLVGVALLVRRRRSEPYPFGPALIAGTMAALLLADRVRR